MGRFQAERHGVQRAPDGGGPVAPAEIGHFPDEYRVFRRAVNDGEFMPGPAFVRGVVVFHQATAAHDQVDIQAGFSRRDKEFLVKETHRLRVRAQSQQFVHLRGIR